MSSRWLRGLNPATVWATCLSAWRGIKDFFNASVAGGMFTGELARIQAPVGTDEASEPLWNGWNITSTIWYCLRRHLDPGLDTEPSLVEKVVGVQRRKLGLAGNGKV